MIAAFAAGLVEWACALLCVVLGMLFVVATTAGALVALAWMVVETVGWADRARGGDDAKRDQS